MWGRAVDGCLYLDNDNRGQLGSRRPIFFWWARNIGRYSYEAEVAPNEPELAFPHSDASSFHYDRGALAEAELFEENHALLPQFENPYTGIDKRALVYLTQGRWDESQRAFDDLLAQEAALASGPQPLYRLTSVRVAELWLARGEYERAEQMFRAVLQHWPEPGPQLESNHLLATLGLAQVLFEQGRTDEAQVLVLPLLELLLRHPQAAELSFQESFLWRATGDALRAKGESAAAEVHLRRAVQIREARDHPDSPWLAQTRITLAECLLDLHRKDEARALMDAAALAHSHRPKLGEHLQRHDGADGPILAARHALYARAR
ncbi:MAG: tetratricopeptide repeat protein [Panacagrimonas sp.]